MRFYEIIRESTDAAPQNGVKEIDLLAQIEQAAKQAAQFISKHPQEFANLEPESIDDVQQEVLDEDWKSTVGKAALAGLIGLTGLSAQANQQVGENLAACGGVFMSIAAVHGQNGDVNAMRKWGDMGLQSLQLARQHIDSATADRIGGNTLNGIKNRLQRNDPSVVKDALQTALTCASLLGQVERQAQQPQVQQVQPKPQAQPQAQTQVQPKPQPKPQAQTQVQPKPSAGEPESERLLKAFGKSDETEAGEAGRLIRAAMGQ